MPEYQIKKKLNKKRENYEPKPTQMTQKYALDMIFVAASQQTGLDTMSKSQRPIKVGIKGRGRSRTSRDSNPASHWPTKCNVGLMSQAVSRT